jgi:plasmid replication initiation protein
MVKITNKKTSNETAKNELIVQHNHLIEAKYKLTLQEKRLMCWLSSQAKPTDEDFKEHELPIKDFSYMLDVKGDHLYKTLDTISKKLMQKIITIRSLTGRDYEWAALLGGAKYSEGKGTIKLSFHPYLKPYMLQLKENFTKITLGDIMGLKSVHSIRIYELLKQYESIGKREVSLEDLRGYCGITIDQYKKFGGFRRKVLETARKEVTKKTDLHIDFEEVKKTRKVVAIKFLIRRNEFFFKSDFEKHQHEKASIISKELRSKNILIEKVKEYGFSRLTAKKFLQQESEEVIREAIKAVNVQIERGNVKNPKAMLQTAIKEHWSPTAFKPQKNVGTKL